MARFRDPYSLADYLLSDAVERLAAMGPKVNIFSVRAVGGAAVLLGFDSLAERCESLLQAIPDGAFTAGMITNFALPKQAPPGMRQLSPIDRLALDHPPLTNGSVAQNVRDCGQGETHLRLAADRRYDEAFAACQTELDCEETAAAQAVLGDIDAALESAASRVKPSGRSDNVRFICTIERFRREQWDEADELLSKIYARQIGPWSAAQMALGANHRVPWIGYPFPDW